MPAQKFLSAHAGHPHWKAALDQCIAHLQGQIAAQAAPRDFSLGFCYLTDYFAAAADDIDRKSVV